MIQTKNWTRTAITQTKQRLLSTTSIPDRRHHSNKLKNIMQKILNNLLAGQTSNQAPTSSKNKAKCIVKSTN